MSEADWLEAVQWDERGLAVAVAQEVTTGEVLMQAYVNREALAATVRDGVATYWSRSRGQLWRKGETSGHTQALAELRLDCDGDTLLFLVRQTGPACHTGARNCFYYCLDGEQWAAVEGAVPECSGEEAS